MRTLRATGRPAGDRRKLAKNGLLREQIRCPYDSSPCRRRRPCRRSGRVSDGGVERRAPAAAPPAARRMAAGEPSLVTFDKSDARSLLAGEAVTYAHSPTNRNLRNLFRNSLLAVRLLR